MWLAETEFLGFKGDGDRDLRIFTEQGRTWVVWEQAPGVLNWLVLEPDGRWSPPRPESLGERGGEEAARFRI